MCCVLDNLSVLDVGSLMVTSRATFNVVAPSFRDRVFFWSFGGRWPFKYHVDPPNAIVYLNRYNTPGDPEVPKSVKAISLLTEHVIGGTRNALHDPDTERAGKALSANSYISVTTYNYLDTLAVIKGDKLRGIVLGNCAVPEFHAKPPSVTHIVLRTAKTTQLCLMDLPPKTASLVVTSPVDYTTDFGGALSYLPKLTVLKVALPRLSAKCVFPNSVKELVLWVEYVNAPTLALPTETTSFSIRHNGVALVLANDFRWPEEWPRSIKTLLIAFPMPPVGQLPKTLKHFYYDPMIPYASRGGKPHTAKLHEGLLTVTVLNTPLGSGVSLPSTLKYLAASLGGCSVCPNSLEEFHALGHIPRMLSAGPAWGMLYDIGDSIHTLRLHDFVTLGRYPPGLKVLSVASQVLEPDINAFPASLEELCFGPYIGADLNSFTGTSLRVVVFGKSFDAWLGGLPACVVDVTILNTEYCRTIALGHRVRSLHMAGYRGNRISLPDSIVKFILGTSMAMWVESDAPSPPTKLKLSKNLELVCLNMMSVCGKLKLSATRARVIVLTGRGGGRPIPDMPPTVTRLYLSRATEEEVQALSTTIARVCVGSLKTSPRIITPARWMRLPEHSHAECAGQTFKMFKEGKLFRMAENAVQHLVKDHVHFVPIQAVFPENRAVQN